VTDARYAVSLLGGFALTRDHAPQELQPAAQRLLALLALQPRRSRSRAALACRLRPGASEAHALGSLRSVLWRLQRSQPGLVDTTLDVVRLAPSVTVDVEVLQLIVDGRATGAEPALTAAGLPDGDLLPGWEDDWVGCERERVRQLWMHALEVLVLRLAAQRRYGAALEAALRVVGHDPLRESAHRLVIEVHLAEGNVVEAVRQSEACRRLLHDELGLDPSPLMREVHAALPGGRD
jgi:DNA-binding SARP family transcriptional activator